MGLAVEQGKHMLPEKHTDIGKSRFVLAKSAPRYSAISAVNNFRNFEIISYSLLSFGHL